MAIRSIAERAQPMPRPIKRVLIRSRVARFWYPWSITAWVPVPRVLRRGAVVRRWVWWPGLVEWGLVEWGEWKPEWEPNRDQG